MYDPLTCCVGTLLGRWSGLAFLIGARSSRGFSKSWEDLGKSSPGRGNSRREGPRADCGWQIQGHHGGCCCQWSSDRLGGSGSEGDGLLQRLDLSRVRWEPLEGDAEPSSDGT